MSDQPSVKEEKGEFFSLLNVAAISIFLALPVLILSGRTMCRVSHLIPSAFGSLKLPVICIMAGPAVLQIINISSIFIEVGSGF